MSRPARHSAMTPSALIQWRKDQGLSQTELAEKWETTRRTVSRWETGVTPIPFWVQQAVTSTGEDHG